MTEDNLILAVDVGGTKIAAAVITTRGKLLGCLPEPTGQNGPEAGIAQIICLAETAAEMARQGKPPERVFVSPNIREVPKSNNAQVFEDYTAFERGL